MNRRDVMVGAASLVSVAFSGWAMAAAAPLRLVVLIELRGGNDGLNTIVPADDGRYRDLRPRLALADDSVLRWSHDLAVHASLAPLSAVWQAGELAVVQGVGYAQPDLSHFRSIEIWDTASESSEVLQQGWLTRAAQSYAAVFSGFAADGVIVGTADLGPLSGGARAVSIADPGRFARSARLAHADNTPARGALGHILRVEHDIVRAGSEIRPETRTATEFPRTPFGQAMSNAAAIAGTRRVPVIRVTLGGFDTHQNQLPIHAALLRQLAEGIAALRLALIELGLWQQTMIATYSEFGRRPRQNGSGGTDHGTVGVQFVCGGQVRGGTYGVPPDLGQLDRNGNLSHHIDFRSLYATVIEQWWKLDSEPVLRRRVAPLALLREDLTG